jgi:hypothetical protein
MSMRVYPFRVLVALLAGLLAWQALADDGRTRPSYSRLLDIDALIDSHCRFLTRRYNLSEEQEEFTRALLHHNADQFLAKHRDELFNVVDQLFDVRAGGEMSPEELVAWGQQALPLYEEAKQLIIQGNDEWREILTEEQKRIHDEDLAQMYESFDETEYQLDRVVSGQMTLEELRRGPRRMDRQRPREPVAVAPPPPAVQPQSPRAVVSDNPPRPVQKTPPRHTAVRTPNQPVRNRADLRNRYPTPRQRVTPKTSNAAAGGKNFESQWEAYVRQFIERHKLDEGQQQKAHAVLKDCQGMANRRMRRAQSRIEHIEKQIAELNSRGAGDERNRQQIARLQQYQARLLAPIDEIFEKRLKPRLDGLLTTAQRLAAQKSPSDAAADRRSPRERPESPVRPEPVVKHPRQPEPPDKVDPDELEPVEEGQIVEGEEYDPEAPPE